MKHFTLAMILGMGLVTASAVAVLADTSSGGNQLGNQLTSQNQTHWYEKAATSVGPVDPTPAKGGTLLVLQAGSFLYLEGNSTLHKYQMNANSLRGSASVKAPGGDLAKALKAGAVEDMELVVPVNTLKSRESGLDDNAHKALKAKENPEIRFLLKKETLKAGKEAGAYVMTAKGDLTIAGATAAVTLAADTTIKDGQVRLKGVQKLKMTDFKVTPPSISLLVASITCTDDVEVHYDVVFGAKK